MPGSGACPALFVRVASIWRPWGMSVNAGGREHSWSAGNLVLARRWGVESGASVEKVWAATLGVAPLALNFKAAVRWIRRWLNLVYCGYLRSWWSMQEVSTQLLDRHRFTFRVHLHAAIRQILYFASDPICQCALACPPAEAYPLYHPYDLKGSPDRFASAQSSSLVTSFRSCFT